MDGYPGVFRHLHSPQERGTNENTNEIVREYFREGTEITDGSHYFRPASK